jgi:hypothetical protein
VPDVTTGVLRPNAKSPQLVSAEPIVIRIRRIDSRIPFLRRYEVEVAGDKRVTRSPVSVLESTLGVGDAWSFVDEADRRWNAGDRGSVEFDQRA